VIVEQPSVRDCSVRELCRIVAAGLVGKSSSEILKFAQSIGISLAELREVIQGAVPTIPSAEQTALLLERVVTATDPGWLRKLRERAVGWRFDANECGMRTRNVGSATY
jgi:hypothetical protein